MRKSIIIREEEHPEYLLRCAASSGFEEVSISFGSTDLFTRPDYRARIDQIKGWLDETGLVCGQTHLPCYHLTVSSEITDEVMELAIKRCIEESARLGAKWTAFHPRTAVNQGYNRTKSFADNQAVLADYLEVAEKCGTGIAVENMPLYPYTAPYYRFFGGGWEELCELCDSFHSDKIGICWDFGHGHTASLDQAAAIRDMGSRLKITHVHDNYRNGDHHQLPLLGDTQWKCMDWSVSIAALKEIGYTGALALELIYPPLPMCESFISLAYDCLDCLEAL